MSDKKFDELFQEEMIDIDLNKKIKKNMNKKIYSKVIKSFIVICLVIVVAFFGTSCFMNFVYYNPNNEEKFLVGEDYSSEFDVLLTTYYQMMNPGLVYLPASQNEKVQSLGLGRYQTEARIQSTLEQVQLGLIPNTKIKVAFSDIRFTENNTTFTRTVDEFKDPLDKDFQYVMSLKKSKEEIKKLPESAYLDVALSFKDYLSLEELCQLINKYPNAYVNWIALKDQQISIVNGVYGGMSLVDVFGWSVNKEKYPDFILTEDQMTAKTLKQKYLSQLKLLIDHPNFLKALSSLDNGEYSNISKLKENYNKAQKELLAFGVRMNIEKNDLLKMMEEENVSYVYIHDMKLSQYQK